MTYAVGDNPADHTVADVTVAMAQMAPEQVESVKAAEGAEDGKKRKGILEWEPAPSGEPDEDGYTRVLVEDAYRPGDPIERDEDADQEGDEPQA